MADQKDNQKLFIDGLVQIAYPDYRALGGTDRAVEGTKYWVMKSAPVADQETSKEACEKAFIAQMRAPSKPVHPKVAKIRAWLDDLIARWPSYNFTARKTVDGIQAHFEKNKCLTEAEEIALSNIMRGWRIE